MDTDNFDIFEDRVKSLLERWRKFHDKQMETNMVKKLKMKNIPKQCIEGFLLEINDGYTEELAGTKK